MSTLCDAIIGTDFYIERWKRHVGQAGERGILLQDLIKSAGEGTNREKIAQIATNLMQILEGDVLNFHEGWARLESVCYECNISLSKKYSNNEMISDDEMDLLMESVMVIKKVASCAAFLWKSVAVPGSFFSDLDLSARKIFIEQAKSNKIDLKGVDYPWVRILRRSSENTTLNRCLHSG